MNDLQEGVTPAFWMSLTFLNGEEGKQSLRPGGFNIASLNVGGRNTNPLEFVMHGDDSDIGKEHAAVMARTLEAMNVDSYVFSYSELERTLLQH